MGDAAHSLGKSLEQRQMQLRQSIHRQGFIAREAGVRA